MDGYAVLDVETTGFSPRTGDRVVEIAVVLLDCDGRREAEWDSLVNPLRGVGATWVHGISDDDVVCAPAFDRIAGHLAEMFRGRVIVAHNLDFDARFVAAEFDLLGHPVGLDRTAGLCTMRMAQRHTSGKCTLEACCARWAIALDGSHRALTDARASAGLLSMFAADSGFERAWAEGMRGSLALPWPSGLPKSDPVPRA